MEEKDLKDYFILHKKEYEDLIKCKMKLIQYRNFIVENIHNQQVINAMVAIEGKNLFEIIEMKKREEKENE